jgi:putative flippase GtrA
MDEIDQSSNHSSYKQVPPQSEAKRAKSAGSSTGFQFLRYCLVGGANTIISVSILNALLWRDPSHNVQLLVVENSVAYAGGAVSSFFLNKYWTFRRRQRPTLREAGRFLLSVALELVSSNGLLWLAGRALSPFIPNVTVWGNASKLLAVAVGAGLSYLIMRFWIFASGTPDRAIQSGTSPADRHWKESHRTCASEKFLSDRNK